MAQGSRVDVVAAARGASAGFSVLLIGGLMAPLVAVIAPSVAGVWIPAVAVAAFTVAAWRPHRASNPIVHGAVCAVGAYVLVLPLLLPFEAGRNWKYIAITFAMAVVIGGLAGLVGPRFRNKPAVATS